MSELPYLEITPNVMLDTDRVTDEPLSADQKISFLPGDFAAKVYGPYWLNPTNIKRHLTARQFIEYEQYMECFRCRRPCAGLCTSRKGDDTARDFNDGESLGHDRSS